MGLAQMTEFFVTGARDMLHVWLNEDDLAANFELVSIGLTSELVHKRKLQAVMKR
jgi:hypothetical protein